jgi:hypothetical protein
MTRSADSRARGSLQRRDGAELAASNTLLGVRFDVLDSQPVNSAPILLRTLRYVVQNPVRAALVDDPWRWRWSTLRDLAGATFPTWTSLSELAFQLGSEASTLLRALSLADGQRADVPHPRRIDVVSVEAIRQAVASVLRVDPSDVLASRVGRRLLVQTWFEIGSTSTRTLANRLALAERTIRGLRRPPHPGVRSVQLCLGDPRLLGGPVNSVLAVTPV